MANIQEYDKFDICSAYVCAIEYGDFSGITNNEQSEVENFLNNLPDGSMFQYGEKSYFSRDEISGLMADCIETTVFYNAK